MTELPDITDLADLTADDWAAMRQRLVAIGVDAANVAPLLALCAQFPEDDRDPIRLWHLRQRGDAAALAMRLLMFGDVLTQAEATEALGEPIHGVLTDAGLLLTRDEHVRCPLRLAMAGDFYVFGDDLRLGGDVVMGMRETTIPLWRAVTPVHGLQRALDLGCGAGAIALLLCRHAEQVIATDINPRAVALARINVALNGVDNIDVREGDLFAPVANEQFDLIAAHPPYVALPDGMPATSHLHGGPRGDELARRMLAGVAAHLAPGGQAVVLAHWPLRDGESQTLHIRESAGTELNLLVFRLGTTPADDLATFWGQQQRHDAAAVARIREHYAQLGLVGTEACISVLRRAVAAPMWTAVLDVPPPSAGFITADRIQRLFRSCDLLHGPDEALLAARLRLPEGTSVASIRGVPASDGTKTMVMLPPATLLQPLHVTPDTQRFIVAVQSAATVAESGQPLAAVREALARGVLEPVEA
jgi:methylase of polypeptide subunit release factors